jgi:hypothetical protein
MDLKVRKSSFVGRDYRWLGSQHGLDSPAKVVLDLALFDFAAVFTAKRLPAGLVIGKVTASGKFGPYSNAASDGREVASGFLMSIVDVSHIAGTPTGEILSTMLEHGVVIEGALPTNHGLDSAAKTDMAGRVRFR